MENSIELLEAKLREIVAGMIERDGVDGSGCYNYYATLVQRGLPMLKDYDVQIPTYIATDAPACVHYAGSGFGFMGMVLALCGHNVRCYEGDNKRFAGLSHILAEVSKTMPA